MDPSTRIQSNLARRSIKEERQARPVEYLSKTQKRVLIEASKLDSSSFIAYKRGTHEATAFSSLEILGLVKVISDQGEISGSITDKGRLLLYENPKLKFAPPEGKRWKITTFISVLALIVAILAMVRTFL